MSGFVYFIAPKVSRPSRVKIGFTRRCPTKRLADMQTGSPEKLRILAYIEAPQFLEHLLHEAFTPLRTHGEWFRFDGKLFALVSWLFHQRVGASAHPIGEFHIAANGTLHEDMPALGVFQSFDDWDNSVDMDRLGDWLFEEAWSAEKARREAES